MQTALFLHVAAPPTQLSVSSIVQPAVVHLWVCVPLPFDFHSPYICSDFAAVTISPHSQITVDISHILGNLITVIFDYQILRKPLKILSL